MGRAVRNLHSSRMGTECPGMGTETTKRSGTTIMSAGGRSEARTVATDRGWLVTTLTAGRRPLLGADRTLRCTALMAPATTSLAAGFGLLRSPAEIAAR
jgi:hypothetical protein